MMEIINSLLWTFQNILKVIPKDLAEFNQEVFINIGIQGALVFAIFYFPSKWFKAYLIRLFLFVFGIIVLWGVFQRDSILFTFDLYGSIGIFLPHIEIIEISYLLLRERTLFFQLKQQEKEEKETQEEYYQNQFKQRQKEEHQKEQARYDEADRLRQEKEVQKKFEQKKKEKKQYKKEEPKQAKPKSTSRWDSSNPYEVLGIERNASKSEIKKAYRTLSKIYHPDLTLIDKEKNLIIFQKINNAYEGLS